MSRVSSDDQALGYSLGVQTGDLKKYCVRNEITIAYEFIEDHSAKTFERPNFKAFLKYIKTNRGKIDILLFTTWDRFSRNISEALNMIKTLSKYGITAHATEQPLDLSIPENKAMLAFYLVMPEIDNDRRSMKIKGGLRAALKAGRWPRAALKGYKNSRDENNKPIIVPSKDAEYIKYLFSEFVKGRSQADIRADLITKGFSISRAQVPDILRNPVYMGKIVVPKDAEEESTLVKGLQEPLISEAVFYKTQRILENRKIKLNQASSFIRKDELPLRGNLICSKCKNHLTGSASKSKTGAKHFYYHCNYCKKERIPAEKLNNSFKDLLSDISFNMKMKKFQAALIDDRLNVRTEKSLLNKVKIEKKLVELKERTIKLQDMLISGTLPTSDYLTIKTRLEAEKKELEDSIKDASANDKNKLEKLKLCAAHLGHLDELFEEASLENKQQLVSSIFPEKVFFTKNKCRTLKINEVLLLALNSGKGSREIKNGQHAEKTVLSALVDPQRIELWSKQALNMLSTCVADY